MRPIKLKSENKPKKHHSKVKIFLIVIASLTLIAVYDYNVADNVRFYSKWVECAQKPISTKSSGFIGAGVIYYYDSPVFALHRPSFEYFCTSLEAEQAGYSASEDRYFFPNLKKTE